MFANLRNIQFSYRKFMYNSQYRFLTTYSYRSSFSKPLYPSHGTVFLLAILAYPDLISPFKFHLNSA